MKNLVLKNMLPVAVIALAISGAFATTSMQSAPAEDAFQWGYLPSAQGGCSTNKIACDNIPKPLFCQVGGTGAVAYDLNSNCVQALYRP